MTENFHSASHQLSVNKVGNMHSTLFTKHNGSTYGHT